MKPNYEDCPNMDGMWPDDLLEWWRLHRRPEKETLVGLVGVANDRTYRAVRLLARYAFYKAKAMMRRRRGFIREATRYEAICERLYLRLPRAARW